VSSPVERRNGTALARLEAEMTSCSACPRLVAWREEVASTKRAAYANETYWGRPVPGWGDPMAKLLVLGLAPAAHGGNRTGRVFTGDRSGDWLFAALHRAGYANQPTSVAVDDGLVLSDAWISAAVRCAPPDNKPTNEEFERCEDRWLRPEVALLGRLQVVLALGGLAWRVAWRVWGTGSRPAFAHGAVASLRAPAPVVPGPGRRASPAGPAWLVGSYHVSQQNTFTGRLTEPMLDAVLARSRELSG
jgi:uracil-DNA glycosylase family 4